MQQVWMVGVVCAVMWALEGPRGVCLADAGASPPGSGRIQSQIQEQERLRSKLEGEKKTLEDGRDAMQADLRTRQKARQAEEAKDGALRETLGTIQAIDERLQQLKTIAHEARNDIIKSGLDDFKKFTDTEDTPDDLKSTDFDPKGDAKVRPDLPAEEESRRIQMSGESGAVLRDLSPAIRLQEVTGWMERYESLRLKTQGVYRQQLQALHATERFTSMLGEEGRIAREIAAANQAIGQRDGDILRANLRIEGLKQRLDAAVAEESRDIRNTLATIEALEKRIDELMKERAVQRLAEEMSRSDANIEQHRMALQREQAKYERQYREHVSEAAKQFHGKGQAATPPQKPQPPRTMTCPRCRKEVAHVSNTSLCNPCTPPVMSDYGTYYSSRGKSGGKEKAFYSMLPAGTREQIEKDRDRVREQFRRAGPHKGGVAPPSGERIRVPPRSGAR
jgi:hypothetical protein